MKLLRSSFLFLFFVLPSFCFSDIPWSDSVISSAPRPVTCRIYTFVSPSISTATYTTYSNIGDLDELTLYYKTLPFAVGCYKGKASVAYPVQNSTTNSNASFDYSVGCYVLQSTPNSYIQKWFSPRSFSTLNSIYTLAATLYGSGYSGPGIIPVGEDSSRFYFNFDYRSAMADILSSTNSVYRSLVLSHLNSISDSVNNIDYGVSTISSALIPSLSRIEEINSGISSGVSSISESVSSIDSYSSQMNETLHGTFNTMTNISGSVSSIPSYLHSNSNSLDRLHKDNALSNLDVFLGDDTSAWVDFCNWASDNSLISSSDRDYFISEFQSTDSSPSSHRRFFAKSSLQGRVSTVNELLGVYKSMGYTPTGSRPFSQEALSAIGSSFTESTVGEINYLSGRVEDWRDNLGQQLQDWKTSDERGILNVRKDIDDNFTLKDPLHPNSTNRIPYTSFVTNLVVAPVTNSVEKSADQITTNLTDQAEQTRQLLNDKLFNPDSDGVNVRIKWPLRYYSVDEVNVHDAALDDLMHNFYDWSNMVSNMFEGAILSFSEHMPSNSVDWSEWFERWDDFRVAWDSACSNLWLYYSQYNSTFKDFSQDNFKDFDFVSSNTIERVASLGGFSGSYWDFQVATTLLQTDFFQLMFDFYNEVSDVLSQYHDPKTGQPFTPRSALRSIAAGLPSPTAIVSDVGSFTNSYNLTYVVAMSNFLASADSRFTSVIESTFRDHSLPGTIRLFTFNEQSFEIPTGPLSSAFGYLRTGLAFGYSVLLIILLPKYVLFWLRMYSKTFLLALSTSRFRRH